MKSIRLTLFACCKNQVPSKNQKISTAIHDVAFRIPPLPCAFKWEVTLFVLQQIFSKQHVLDTVLDTGNLMVYKNVTAVTEFIAHQGRRTIKQAITTDSLKDHNSVMAVNLIKPLRHCFGIKYARFAITQPTGVRETK